MGSGLGVLSSGLNVYGNLTHRNETSQGTVYDDPQYGQAALNTAAGLGEAYKLRNALRFPAAASTVAPTAAKTVGGALLRNAAPIMGAVGVGSRLLDKDYLGAGIDALSTAAPIVGTMIAPGVGTAIGTGVSWLGQGINAYRDIRKNQQQTKLPPPSIGQAQPQSTQPKVASFMYTSDNDFKIKKAFASGFVKSAVAKGVTIDEFSALTKQALSAGTSLTYDDVSAIKALLANNEGSEDIYSDPTGEAMRNYKSRLLAARDASSQEIPAVSGALAGLRAGSLGGLAGAGIGGSLGMLAKHTPILNLPYRFKRNMPTAGALGGTALGSIIAALPAAKQKYEASKALQKLHSSSNLDALQQLGQEDRAVLNS
jgi:hypothetical protein